MMSPQRLRLLIELEQWGTMNAVGAATGYSTSGVSHQIAVLEQEAGARLIERQGRNVRLTPAGRRLALHAESILAALEAAHADVLQTGSPAGTVRVTAFTSAIEFLVVPVVEDLADRQPSVTVLIDEGEPLEAIEKLHADQTDLAMVYDYTINPRPFAGTSSVLLGQEPVDLVLPRSAAVGSLRGKRTVGVSQLREVANVPWISNSRSREDDELISRVCGVAGFAPIIGHRVDSVGLITRLVADGLGIAIIPRLARPADHDRAVAFLEIADPPVFRRIFALSRAGSVNWPPIKLVREELAARCRSLKLDAGPLHAATAPEQSVGQV
jgi:DNA-binding transcriptional LysR family regulator